MIVREIKDNPDQVLSNFDWFNDYKDTRSYAVYSGLDEIVKRLDEGYDNYLIREWAKFNKER